MNGFVHAFEFRYNENATNLWVCQAKPIYGGHEPILGTKKGINGYPGSAFQTV